MRLDPRRDVCVSEAFFDGRSESGLMTECILKSQLDEVYQTLIRYPHEIPLTSEQLLFNVKQTGVEQMSRR